jgi:citrate synthase
VGAGQYAGAREVFLACELWRECGTDLSAWQRRLEDPPAHWRDSHWPALEHTPGFDPYAVRRALPVTQTLAAVADASVTTTAWLADGGAAGLEALAGRPLAMSGLAAAALSGIGLAPEQAEMLYLILRLPGAAAHALEQKSYGWRHYPFFKDGLELTE